MIEEVVGHDCLDSITSTSTVSLSTSTMLLLHARTTVVTDVAENHVSKSRDGTGGDFGAPHCYVLRLRRWYATNPEGIEINKLASATLIGG